MTTGVHCTEGYLDKASAKTASRRLRLSRRVDTAPKFCKECDAWHLISIDSRIKDVDRTVLFKVASGLRAHEIAHDIGESESKVVNRIKLLMQHFDALSRANLCVLAVFYGLVDPRPIATVDERKGAVVPLPAVGPAPSANHRPVSATPRGRSRVRAAGG